MTFPRRFRTARRGFTLVELMVATALVVLILTILAVAFGAATDSLSRLRSVGNMATDLRTAQEKLRVDLEAQHFEDGDSSGFLRVANLRYDRLPGDTTITTPKGGYFRLEHTVGSTYEGADADTVSSTRAPGGAHAVEFTAKRQGTSPDDLYVVPATTVNLTNLNATDTPLSGGQFVSKWARVRWFLANPRQVGNPAVTVWTLYRSARAVAPANVTLADAKEPFQVAQTGNVTRTLAELTNPVNRTTIGTPYQPGNAYYGDDIVLMNVTSFEVKASWDTATAAPAGRATWPATAIGSSIAPGAGAALANGDWPFDDLPGAANPRVYDTWNNTTNLPSAIRLTALQVKLRVIDPKTLLSRQLSFIVQP